MDEPRKRGDGTNWIEKSSPIGIDIDIDTSASTITTTSDSSSSSSSSDSTTTDGNYDLGLNGKSFDTGPLSKRMYEALTSVAMKRFPPGTREEDLPDDLMNVYRSYAMDMTAREAVSAALERNGLQLALSSSSSTENEETNASSDMDAGGWGSIDSIRLEYDDEDIYDSIEDAVAEGGWSPGDSFSFVARNVPAKLKEMDISDLLKALDPNGEYRDEAKDKGIVMPDEDPVTLMELGKDCERRSNLAPRDVVLNERNAFIGDNTRGYKIMNRNDLLPDCRNMDGSENSATLKHVMNALVNHGCLIVDLTDANSSYKYATKLTKMWNVTQSFFETINDSSNNNNTTSLPPMSVVDGAGSKHAVAGFANYDSNGMEFLETRIRRKSTLLDEEEPTIVVPVEVNSILGEEGVTAMTDSFDIMCEVGKDVVRIATAAANMVNDAFLGVDKEKDGKEEEFVSDLPLISGLTFEEAEITGINMDSDDDDDDDDEMEKKAGISSSEAALLMTNDLVDDGCAWNDPILDKDFGISMSPHRMCRYLNIEKQSFKENNNGKGKRQGQETFGSHTDTSFVTIVPVAEISGLEVFDEEAQKWFRPERLARTIWEEERRERGLDPNADSERVAIYSDDDEDEPSEVDIPWHSRYLVVMPGELLQLYTRNEVPASVHRVITVPESSARLSAPVLLRSRPGISLDIQKYFGNLANVGPLLEGCNGMKTDDIHDAMQPSSFR